MEEILIEIPLCGTLEVPLFEQIAPRPVHEIIIHGKYWFSKKFRVVGAIAEDYQCRELEDGTVAFSASFTGGEVEDVSSQSVIAKVLRFFFRR